VLEVFCFLNVFILLFFHLKESVKLIFFHTNSYSYILQDIKCIAIIFQTYVCNSLII